jgi:hypothetical protein
MLSIRMAPTYMARVRAMIASVLIGMSPRPRKCAISRRRSLLLLLARTIRTALPSNSACMRIAAGMVIWLRGDAHTGLPTLDHW